MHEDYVPYCEPHRDGKKNQTYQPNPNEEFKEKKNRRKKGLGDTPGKKDQQGKSFTA